MSRFKIIQSEIFIPAEVNKQPRVLSNEFYILFKGRNSLSDCNDLMSVKIYEYLENPILDAKMIEVENIIQSQIRPDNFPDLFPLPKYYHNLDELDDGTVTDSVFIWETVPTSDLNLHPIFKIQKVIFMFRRLESSAEDMNELHLVVDQF